MLRIVFRGQALTFNDLADKLWKRPWVTAGSEWGWPNGREANSAVSSRVVWLSTDVFVWRTPIGSHYFGLYVVSRNNTNGTAASSHVRDFLSNTSTHAHWLQCRNSDFRLTSVNQNVSVIDARLTWARPANAVAPGSHSAQWSRSLQPHVRQYPAPRIRCTLWISVGGTNPVNRNGASEHYYRVC